MIPARKVRGDRWGRDAPPRRVVDARVWPTRGALMYADYPSLSRSGRENCTTGRFAAGSGKGVAWVYGKMPGRDWTIVQADNCLHNSVERRR